MWGWGVTRVGLVLFGPLACHSSIYNERPPEAPVAASRLDAVSPATRLAYLERAQVFRAVPIHSQDLRVGPRGPGAFSFDVTVHCDYVDDAGTLSGMTSKFFCRAGDDVLKVKYGTDNGEVYAETAATRLFWALGFGADAAYPVRISCRGCPIDPWLWKTSLRVPEQHFELATVERKFAGKTIEAPGVSGWSWQELDLVDSALGGAPVTHREALKLLAVFVQHGDNKAGQQRLVCLPEGVRRGPAGETCTRPFLVVADLGATFGGAGNLSRDGVAKLNFNEWASKPIFRDKAQCVGELNGSLFGTLQHPRIREAGRRFLAARLTKLADRQIADLFVAARVDKREETTTENGRERRVTVDDWLRVFKEKRAQIAEHRCPY